MSSSTWERVFLLTGAILNSLWCRVLGVHRTHIALMIALCRGCLGLLQFALCSYRSGVLLLEQYRDKPRLPEGKLEPTEHFPCPEWPFFACTVPCPLQPALLRGWVSPGQTSGAASQILMWHNGIDFTGDLVLDNWAPCPSFHHPTAQIAVSQGFSTARAQVTGG